MITYEFPLNERTRTLLRLEDLFSRFEHYMRRPDAPSHHSALLSLFEILEVAGRADLKSELLQELERQKNALEIHRSNPEIDDERLDRVLADIETTSSRLFAMSGRMGQHIRDNEWLMSIKQRTTIPGGTCEFDVPSYHYWLNQPPAVRIEALTHWLAPLAPIDAGIAIVLRLLRDSGRTNDCIAHNGGFQQMASGKQVQLLQVTVADDVPCVPELSADKYMINVRFIATNPLGGERLKQSEATIPFELTFCNL